MSAARAINLVVVVICVLSGCATRRNALSTTTTSTTSSRIMTTPTTAPSVAVSISPATRPALDPKATLALDDIPPRPTLPTTAPSDATAAPAPLDALELYAKARNALAANQRFTAVSLLERAVKLDPHSAELYRTLSRACLASGNPTRAIDALKRAAELDPDDLRTHSALGRLYLTRNDPTAALLELRLAVQTSGYHKDEAGAAVADYFLGRALQQQGYDRAALDQFRSLLQRLERPTLAVRSDPELNDWAAHPHAVHAEVARLCERLGEWQQALVAWRVVAQHEPDDFDASKHVIENLIALGQASEALREAAELVRRQGASTRSLELLRDTCRRLGNEQAAFDEMRRLQKQRPNDRALLFALVDLLGGSDREAEAEELLAGAARASWDPEIVRRLFRFYTEHHRATDAARLLVEAAAARPGDTGALTDRFSELLSASRRDALRASAVAKIEVPPGAEGAKWYFTTLAAIGGGRESMGREMLDRAVAAEPLFPPALKLALNRLPSRAELDEAGKADAAAQFTRLAETKGPPGLADELRAARLVAQGKRDEAIAAYEQAIKLAAPASSADLLVSYAAFLRDAGNRPKFEQTLWRIISDHPTAEVAYAWLINYQLEQRNASGAIAVLQRWLANDPGSVTARLQEAQVLAQAGQSQEALRTAGELVRQNPENANVLDVAHRVYRQTLRLPLYVQLLEDLRSHDPSNVTLARALVEVYLEQQRPVDATRVIDATRAAVASQPRSLYYVANLYSLIEQKDASQQTLLDVLKLDPEDPGANNDLGYTWAEDGVNLDRAERMVRVAVQAEPDNSSFLDSLGWVLYKRGRFDEARQHLEQAVSPGETGADPVVLDHLGDTLYRLRQRDRAVSFWQKAEERLASAPDVARPDWQKLRATLQVKLRQAKLGQPVEVAPAAGNVGGPADTAAEKPARAER